jgi:hypothetical protein
MTSIPLLMTGRCRNSSTVDRPENSRRGGYLPGTIAIPMGLQFRLVGGQRHSAGNTA